MKNKLFLLSSIIFPLFSGFVFVSAPVWSSELFFISLFFVSFDILFAILILFGMNYERFFVIIQFDLFCFFFLAVTNRVLKGGVILAIILIIIAALSVYFGNKFSNHFKHLFSFGAISGTSAGVIGLTFGKISGMTISAIVLPFVCVYILLFIHAAWKKRSNTV